MRVSELRKFVAAETDTEYNTFRLGTVNDDIMPTVGQKQTVIEQMEATEKNGYLTLADVNGSLLKF